MSFIPIKVNIYIYISIPSLGPRETSGLGLGILPIFVYMGQDNPKIPTIKKTDEEISTLLRMVSMPMVGGYQDVASTLKGSWPVYIESEPELLWRPAGKQPPSPQPTGKDLRLLPGKYCQQNGPYSLDSVVLSNTPAHLRSHHVALLNASKAYRTWRGESSTGRHVMKVEQEHNLNLEFPWDLSKANNYIVAASLDGLAASSLTVYVSRIRALHIRQGLQPNFSLKQVAGLIKGAAQLEVQPEVPKNRICITPELMKHARNSIQLAPRPDSWKALMWLMCTWSWLGAFRSDDLIHDSPTAFCPETSLLKRNIIVKTEYLGQGTTVTYLRVWVPSPKHKKGSGGIWIELLPSDNWFCPVQAFVQYKDNSVNWGEDKPLLHLNGSLYTKSRFNNDLRYIFNSKVDFDREQITAHSFRSGVISALARAGASEDLLKSQTDHSSSAYQSYLKLGRSSRLGQQRKVMSTLEDLAMGNFGSDSLLVK